MRKVFREGDLISVSVTSLAAGGVLPAVAVCSLRGTDLLTGQRALAVLMRPDAHGGHHYQEPAAAKGMQQV